MDIVVQYIGKIDASIVIATASLIVSYIALHYTILKRGQVVVRIYSRIKDVRPPNGSTFLNVRDSFIIALPVLLKNNGANPVAIKNVRWKIIVPEYLEYDLFSIPSIHSVKNDLTVLKPYDHIFDNLQMTIKLKGYGTGHSNEYKALVESIPNRIRKDRVEIELSYLLCGANKMKQKTIRFDISKLIRHFITTEPNT